MASRNLRIGIVGAGYMGEKRQRAIKETAMGKVLAVADIYTKKAKSLAKNSGADVYADWKKLVARPDLDIIIVSTPNNLTAKVVVEAFKNKKHVLCEKPMGINVKEAKTILSASQKAKRLLKVGFNHRFHPGIYKAKQLFKKGVIGKPLFLRARYGHGGRWRMEKEWRLKKSISGGGELLDQGIHVIDLFRWFAGDFKKAFGVTDRKFWKGDVEDNAFVILEKNSVTAMMHASLTQWKNLFSFEVFGDKGFLQIEGLGGSYGKEKLTFGKRPEKFGKPKMIIEEFGEDTSWREEWKNFIGAIRGKNKLIGNGEDGLEANKIVEAIYKSSVKKGLVKT